MTEDEMVGWHHQLNGHEFKQTLGDSEGQGSLECCHSWGHKESHMTEQLNHLTLAHTDSFSTLKWNYYHPILQRFPWWLSGKESACQAGDSFNPCIRKISWRRKWQPIQVFLPGKSLGQKNVVGYTTHTVTKSQT